MRRRPALIKIRSAIKSSRYLRLVYERGREARARRGRAGAVITYLCGGGSALAAEKLPSRRQRGGGGERRPGTRDARP